MECIKFANLTFRGLTKKDILIEEDFLKFIVTVNAEFIVKGNKNHEFREIINSNYATFDGQVPYFFAKNKNKNKKFQKLSGSNLIYDFCEMAKKSKKKLFLLGGYSESNKIAVKKLSAKYMIEVDGFSPEYKEYPFEKSHNELILNKIRNSEPHILFVGFGAVKQELWINEHKHILEDYGVRWVVGSGGTFEFVAGTIKRAPRFIEKAGFEGVYRMVQEPNLARMKRLYTSFKMFKYVYQKRKH